MNEYNGLIDDILYYSKTTEDGRWIIPIEVDWDFTITKCSRLETNEMVLNEEAFEVMRRWIKDYNIGWILNSMRNDEMLKEPLKILENEGIKLYGLRKNPVQVNDERNKEVTKSFAVFSIDDRNFGVPVKWLDGCNRPYVDWKKVDKLMSPILKQISDKLNKN